MSILKTSLIASLTNKKSFNNIIYKDRIKVDVMIKKKLAYFVCIIKAHKSGLFYLQR